MKKFYILLTLSLLIISGCKDDDVDFNPITVTQVDSQLNLLNNTEERLYYFIVDQNTLAVINWAPSVGENQANIAPNGQARIPLNGITGYSDESEVIVIYYWKAITVDNEPAPGPVNHVLFEL